MKELEALTGVNREAIRFYIREGILPEPEKPKRNVAYYSEEHVQRIKLIRKLQYEKFLPLSVIKNIFDQTDESNLSEGLATFELNWLAMMSGEVGPAQSLVEVSEKTGFKLTQLQELAEAGVIHIVHVEGVDSLETADIAIVEAWAELGARGFTAERGYDAEYLKTYADIASTLAATEVDHFLNAFADASAKDSAELAAEGVARANELLSMFHSRELRAKVRERVDLSAKQ